MRTTALVLATATIALNAYAQTPDVINMSTRLMPVAAIATVKCREQHEAEACEALGRFQRALDISPYTTGGD